NELIYSMRRPLSTQNVRHATAWVGEGPALAVGPRELEAINQVVGKIRWPDVRTLAGLKRIEGLTLPRATALLHFHNPSFPPFQAGAVQGMALLGKRVRRPDALSLDNVRAYRRWMDAVAALKEQIPFRCVPESHYFHSWVLECCLAELARTSR
ncbi:MAG TPA: hypothetical protein VGR28_12175, partial [Candidatus Thermoplasmatota archaeon]|nr:hypothetical protein [Candidatus Thermoplasmatota archaeon]